MKIENKRVNQITFIWFAFQVYFFISPHSLRDELCRTTEEAEEEKNAKFIRQLYFSHVRIKMTFHLNPIVYFYLNMIREHSTQKKGKRKMNLGIKSIDFLV